MHSRAALEQALTESPVASLTVVAKQLRVSKAQLRAQFRDLCAGLGKRYRMGAQETQYQNMGKLTLLCGSIY